MTLTFECDPVSVKMNQDAKYPGEKSFRSKSVRTHTHTDTYQVYCPSAPLSPVYTIQPVAKPVVKPV